MDSIPDVAVTSSDGYLTIMLGRGDGFFNVGNKYFVGSPEGVVAGDFNHDGNQDLAVASNNGFVAVFLGDGAGSFNRIADLPPGPNAGTVPTYLATADMDSDGNLDLVVADFSHPNVLVYTRLIYAKILAGSDKIHGPGLHWRSRQGCCGGTGRGVHYE